MESKMNDELLIRYLTETAGAEEIEEVDHWVSLSPENQAILEQLYFTLQASARLRIIQSTDTDKALQDLKERIRRKKISLRRRKLWERIQQVAAILFLPVLILSLGMLLQKHAMPVQTIELYSNPGMVASFMLPDGSKVWLNGGSRLRYPNEFRGDKREVEMSGEGYFEIAHEAEKPFLVKTGESFSLEVLGTSFNLSAYEDEDIIETTLVKGSLRLNLMQDGKRVQHLMKPNEKLIYTKNKESGTLQVVTAPLQPIYSISSSKDSKTEKVKIANVDPKYDIAWKDRQILFKNHPMEQVIRTLGRYYNVEFVVKNAEIMNSEITGKFSNEQLPQVMEYLKIASDIKYNIVHTTVANGETKPEIVEIWK